MQTHAIDRRRAPAPLQASVQGSTGIGGAGFKPKGLSERGHALLKDVVYRLSQRAPPSSAELTSYRDRALKLDKSSAFEVHMEMCSLLVKSYNMRVEALESGRSALDLRPKSSRALFRIGNVYFSLGDHVKARECYERALRAGDVREEGADLQAKVHVNLGITLEVQGLLINACEQYREAFLVCPKLSSAAKLLGSALYELGEYEASVEALQLALALKPDYVDAQCDLGLAYYAAGKYPDAKAALEQALRIDPGHVETNYNLANMLRDNGELAVALDYYRAVVSRSRGHWRAQMNLAAVLGLLGRQPEALDALREANRTRGIVVEDAQEELQQLDRLVREQNRRILEQERAPVSPLSPESTASPPGLLRVLSGGAPLTPSSGSVRDVKDRRPSPFGRVYLTKQNTLTTRHGPEGGEINPRRQGSDAAASGSGRTSSPGPGRPPLSRAGSQVMSPSDVKPGTPTDGKRRGTGRPEWVTNVNAKYSTGSGRPSSGRPSQGAAGGAQGNSPASPSPRTQRYVENFRISSRYDEHTGNELNAPAIRALAPMTKVRLPLLVRLAEAFAEVRRRGWGDVGLMLTPCRRLSGNPWCPCRARLPRWRRRAASRPRGTPGRSVRHLRSF